MEAHAADTWPMGFEVEIPQTFTNESRCTAACDFINTNNYDLPTMIDEAPANEFNKFFAAWPLRFYVIEYLAEKNSVDEGKYAMTFIHEPEGDLVLVERVVEFLERRLR